MKGKAGRRGGFCPDEGKGWQEAMEVSVLTKGEAGSRLCRRAGRAE